MKKMPAPRPSDSNRQAPDDSEDPELKRAELEGIDVLLSHLRDRWHNADFDAFSERYDAAAGRSNEADRTATDERYRTLEAAYSVFLLALAQDKLGELLDRYRHEGIRIQSNSHPLHVILRARMALKQKRTRK